MDSSLLHLESVSYFLTHRLSLLCSTQMFAWQPNIIIPLLRTGRGTPLLDRTTMTATDSFVALGDGEPTSRATGERAMDIFEQHAGFDSTASGPLWSQAQFSITLPPIRESGSYSRTITKSVNNGLAPLLNAVQSGVGLLQVLNCTASLMMAPSKSVRATDEAECLKLSAQSIAGKELLGPAVALNIRKGSAMWGQGQELWLFQRDENVNPLGGESGGLPFQGESPASPRRIANRGSVRFDFLVLWSSTATGGDTLDEECRGRRGLEVDTCDDGNGKSTVRGEWQRGGHIEGVQQQRGLGPAGGHMVGELRPLNEFSAERQAALDKVSCGSLRALRHVQTVSKDSHWIQDQVQEQCSSIPLG